MKKHLFTATLIVTLGLAAGCGAQGTSGDVTTTTVEQEAEMLSSEDMPEQEMVQTDMAQEETGTTANTEMEATTITGVVEEMKDFMFIFTDEAGTSYAFSYSAEDELDLSAIKVGDKVNVSFTGTVSEVDAFNGKVLSVEKVEE